MSFLFKREREEGELDWDARSFLAAVSDGLGETEAAEQAGVDVEELRAWKRNSVFRAALRRAKTEGPGLTARGICSLEAFSDDPPSPGTPDLQIGQAGWHGW